MALQGTLDTFALADVLRLLAATTKTGRLQIDGDRGVGSIWLVDGAVVAGVVDLHHPAGSDGIVPCTEPSDEPSPPTTMPNTTPLVQRPFFAGSLSMPRSTISILSPSARSSRPSSNHLKSLRPAATHFAC